MGAVRRFKKVRFCSWQVSPDSPDTLDSEDCQVTPDANSDRFEYRLSGNTLILTGIEVDPKPRELISMRFERGPLVPRWRQWKKPEPETCNAASLPRWASSATRIASDGDLAWSRPADLQSLIRDRNRLLWDAVSAYSGSGPPIAPKATTSSIEGDSYEEYLLVSRGHVEVVDHTDDGLITHLNTCTSQAPIIKLKVQDSNKLWGFATSAPSLARRAYVVSPAVFPYDDSGSGIFPRL